MSARVRPLLPRRAARRTPHHLGLMPPGLLDRQYLATPTPHPRPNLPAGRVIASIAFVARDKAFHGKFDLVGGVSDGDPRVADRLLARTARRLTASRRRRCFGKRVNAVAFGLPVNDPPHKHSPIISRFGPSYNASYAADPSAHTAPIIVFARHERILVGFGADEKQLPGLTAGRRAAAVRAPVIRPPVSVHHLRRYYPQANARGSQKRGKLSIRRRQPAV